MSQSTSKTLTVKYCSSWSSKSIIWTNPFIILCVSTYLLWNFTSAFHKWTVSVYLNTLGSLANTTLICWAHLRITENRWHQPDSCCVTSKQKQPAACFSTLWAWSYSKKALRTQTTTVGRKHFTNLEDSTDELPEEG